MAGCTTRTPEKPFPVVHRFAALEEGLFVNAYLVETANGVVAIDATLTVSDAHSLRSKVAEIGKPLSAILITHGHPDHYNGAHILRGDADVPIISTVGVDRVIREYDAAKEEQWRPMFEDQWPSPRAFPTRTVTDGEAVTFDGVAFTAHDLGPGESHSDSYWSVSEGGKRYAFIGDVVLNHVHAYVSDGHTTEWLATLDKLEDELKGFALVYPGHGAPGGPEILDWQRTYLETYRTAVRELQRDGLLDDRAKEDLARRMMEFLPSPQLVFLVVLGADVVAAELQTP
jgi:glyoxylase-like metal-dependent hydrolase (beta-lactamase superfamily II)